MKHCKRIISLLLVIPIILLTGCNLFFDPAAYVQASLDAIYKGEFTAYLEMVDISPEEAQKNYEESYKSEADLFAQRYSIKSLSDGIREQIEQLYQYLYSQVNYTVGESRKTENGYSVDVTVRPITFFAAEQQKVTDYSNQFNADILNGVYNDIPEQQFEDTYALGLLDIFNADKGNLSYGDEQNLSIAVQKNEEDNSYSINTTDLLKLQQTVIVYV